MERQGICIHDGRKADMMQHVGALSAEVEGGHTPRVCCSGQVGCKGRCRGVKGFAIQLQVQHPGSLRRSLFCPVAASKVGLPLHS